MTAVLDRAAPPAPRLRRDRRRWAWALAGVVLVGWALAGSGLLSGPVLNPAGAGQAGRFLSAALHPELDGGFHGVDQGY